MEHIWSSKSKSIVCYNYFSEYIQDHSNLNLGYNAKSKLKLSVPSVAGSKSSLTYSTSNNSVQSVLTNRNHGASKQDKVDLYSSSSESVINNFKKILLTLTSAPLI